MDKRRVEPTKCRHCGALILWAQRGRDGRLISVGAAGDERGNFVLFARQGRVLRAETFDATLHGTRKRYAGHRASCAAQEDTPRARFSD